MAHWRTRFIEAEINSALKWSPCVVLLGMRQTGKTSLLRRLSRQYLTFDDDSLPALFEREGSSLLSQGPFPLALDEVQKHPRVFDQLKLFIDRVKAPGRYLLTGSVRFSQKRNIRESLTGRTAPFELLPLSLAESYRKPASNFLSELVGRTAVDFLARRTKKVWASLQQMEQYQTMGGLPGICFKRNSKVRAKLFEQHLDTLLGRDIYLLLETRLRASELREILSILYAQQGLTLSFAAMARQFGYSAPTMRRIVDAFEGLFLLRRVGSDFYAEDQGLASFCSATRSANQRSGWLGLLHHEIRCQIALMGSGYRLTNYRTRGGAEVPFVIHVPGEGLIAVTLDAKERVSEKNLKSLGSLDKTHSGKKRLIAFHLGEVAYMSHRQVLCLPINWIA